jgi:uncharacterized membrane protein
MTTSRLEAFSDGVIAIIITIMVLELKIPHGAGWAAIRPLGAPLGVYVLSFIYVGIYWNNHHHMFYATERVNGVILWANLHLLFWLSLVPVVTGWMGENHFATLPTAGYGVVLLMASIAYWILQSAIIRAQGAESVLKRAVGTDVKGNLSPLLYAAAIALAFVNRWVSVGLYVVVALMWLIPDRRIERTIAEKAA